MKNTLEQMVADGNNIELIREELGKARAKHDIPFDCFTRETAGEVAANLRTARKRKAPYGTARAVLEEEMYEAMEAYAARDYGSCVRELARCGAVVLRMMEHVRGIMEANEAKGAAEDANGKVKTEGNKATIMDALAAALVCAAVAAAVAIPAVLLAVAAIMFGERVAP